MQVVTTTFTTFQTTIEKNTNSRTKLYFGSFRQSFIHNPVFIYFFQNINTNFIRTLLLDIRTLLLDIIHEVLSSFKILVYFIDPLLQNTEMDYTSLNY